MSCIFAQVMRFRGGTTFKTAWLTCGIPHPKRKMNRKLLSLYGPSSLKLDYITYSKRQTFQFCMTTMNVLLAKDWPKKSFKRKTVIHINISKEKLFLQWSGDFKHYLSHLKRHTGFEKNKISRFVELTRNYQNRVLLKLVFCSWTS